MRSGCATAHRDAQQQRTILADLAYCAQGVLDILEGYGEFFQSLVD
ncbi:MAG TPA: hypothetical protein VFR11_11975 [Micromonosporaceae bacterium]|nr:hypothetical protein [Micromonosporaceae bacterium]